VVVATVGSAESSFFEQAVSASADTDRPNTNPPNRAFDPECIISFSPLRTSCRGFGINRETRTVQYCLRSVYPRKKRDQASSPSGNAQSLRFDPLPRFPLDGWIDMIECRVSWSGKVNSPCRRRANAVWSATDVVASFAPESAPPRQRQVVNSGGIGVTVAQCVDKACPFVLTAWPQDLRETREQTVVGFSAG
jgi:hypothetical protein